MLSEDPLEGVPGLTEGEADGAAESDESLLAADPVWKTESNSAWVFDWVSHSGSFGTLV